MQRIRIRSGMLAVVAAIAVGGATAVAQTGGMDFNMRALDWARGRYASPLYCEIEGKPVRGLRRMLVTPGPRHARPPVGKLVFVKLEVEPTSRCFTELGGDVPNIAGALQIRHHSNLRGDLTPRQFDVTLRREKGFEYHIPEGHLILQDLGANPGPARRVDFKGGTARLHLAGPGSDAARLLADLPSGRRAVLELKAPKGEVLRFPVAMIDAR